MPQVTASKAYFIKLGEGGEWEDECLSEGTIRFGYRRTPHDLCLAGNWDAVREVWSNIRKDAGAATRDTNQIRTFYESSKDTLFITFAHGRLHWCQPNGPIELLADGWRKRRTVNGWRSESVGGSSLTMDRLSGNLLKTQMVRGTICQVRAFDYLMRKLNDELSPEVAAADDAERRLTDATTGMLRLLTWQDFELLVDLVFSASGWRRISVVGGTQKTVDLELVLPTTGERAFVQVKSQANTSSLRDCIDRFSESDTYGRMFFVWHSGEVADTGNMAGITLVGPERLSRMILNAGLFAWLRDKVS